MGRITILEETTKNPLTLMGRRAGVCWGADTTDDKKNYKRGLDCLESGHGRVMEYVNVEMVIDGYSARVIREWYTHLGGSPTRLQASTRYIDYSNFSYIIPSKIAENTAALQRYGEMMKSICETCSYLEQECGIPGEDAALLLPLGMTTKIVDKRNLRNLVNMSRQRMCSRAYWEYRGMFSDICQAISGISEEWEYIVKNYFFPKCEVSGFCPERKPCGRNPKKGDLNG